MTGQPVEPTEPEPVRDPQPGEHLPAGVPTERPDGIPVDNPSG